MSETVTLELPEPVIRSAKEVAARTQRRLEDVLMDWIDRVATELPVELLPDEEVLALSEIQMDPEEQEELSDLLACHREGLLNEQERMRFRRTHASLPPRPGA